MNNRKDLEELAAKRGVVLAKPRQSDKPAAPAASAGFLSRAMPNVAAFMSELKERAGAEIYEGALDNLKKGRGYAVDLETNIAIGNPPVELFERGKAAERNGFNVVRVRRRQ